MFAKTGQRLPSEISWYPFALIFPSTDAALPGPNQEMHPHIITLNFDRGFCETRSGYQPSPAFLQTYMYTFFLSWPIIILLSSEKISFINYFQQTISALPDTTRAGFFLHFFYHKLFTFYSSFNAVFV